MSPSVSITVRQRASGRRYVVRYRLGGRRMPVLHGGSFKTRREAEERARWIAGEIAAMRVPDLRALEAPREALTVPKAAAEWLEGRINLSDSRLRGYRRALGRIEEGWAGVGVAEIDRIQVKAWVARLVAEGVGASAIGECLIVLRCALDDHRDPNPARHASIEKPSTKAEEANPPPHAHWQVILDTVSRRYRLPLRLIEATGIRPGELVALRWGALDVRGSRIWVAGREAGGRKTPAGRRMLPVPPDLMAEVDALVPREDRDPDARVFAGLDVDRMRGAMTSACTQAGIPVYSPYDLRHRFITLCIRRGMDVAAVAALAGHTRKSLTLDTYTHLLLEES